MPGTETEEAVAPYPRNRVERLVACRMLAGLLTLLSVLAILAPSKATIYQLIAFVPVVLWLVSECSQKRLPASLEDEATRPTHPWVLGAYAVAGVTAMALSFGTWHATEARDFSGFDRGAGWYTLVFGLLLVASVVALREPSLMRPFDTALHVVALTCGTLFVAAALSGTYSAGMSTLRSIVLLSGIVVMGTASGVLNRRADDMQSRQAYAGAMFAAGGVLMMAASRMSWGAGGFLVNYWPGSSMGGFDGRITLWGGAAIVTIWIARFLWAKTDEASWRGGVVATALLAFAGFAAVVNSARGDSHPGRVLAAAACVFVLVRAARAPWFSTTSSEDEPSSGVAIATRTYVGVTAVFGALLVAAGSARSATMATQRIFGRLDYDSAMAGVTFGGLGVALLACALGAASRRPLSAWTASVVFGGLALVFLFPPSRTTSTGLIIAMVLAGLATAGVLAKTWKPLPDAANPSAALTHTVRTRWIHIVLTALVTYALGRWALPEVLPYPTLSDQPNPSEIDEYSGAIRRLSAVQSAILFSLVAFATTARGQLARAAAFTTGSAILYFGFRLALADRFDDVTGEDAWTANIALATVIVVVFALGRGKHSLAAVAAVVAATNPTLLQTLIHLVVPMRVFQLPGGREVLWAVPQIVQYAALAAVFLALPHGQGSEEAAADGPETPDSGSRETDPEAAFADALVGSADGTER